jgi:uncharacterized protein
MGKRAKEHRKRVVKRNERLKSTKKKFEKEYQELLVEKFKEMQEKYSGVTNTEEITNESESSK